MKIGAIHDPEHKRKVMLGYLYESGQLPPGGDYPPPGDLRVLIIIAAFIAGVTLGSVATYLLITMFR